MTVLAWSSNVLLVLPVVCAVILHTEGFLPIAPCGGGRTQKQRGQQQRAMSTTAIAMASSSPQDTVESYQGGDYTVFVGRGMSRFRSGRVDESIQDFDRALLLQPRLRPYMWQRGLSLYYAGRFEEGAKQFRQDVDVNPNDMEEAIWAFMCEARMEGIGFDAARRRMLPAGADRRPYMRAAYALFSGYGNAEDLARQMETGSSSKPGAAGGSSGSKPATIAPYFYANLYLGLYAEARGDAPLARKYISTAVRSAYGASGDYMYDLAKVHMLVRGW